MQGRIGAKWLTACALFAGAAEIVRAEEVCAPAVLDPEAAFCADECVQHGTAAPSAAAASLCESPYMTGDWGGFRTELAESGISAAVNVTQFYFGVTDGGVDRDFRYSGHGDYVVNLDGGKLGWQKGLFVKIRAENRFGESINTATGALLPATVLADLPDPTTDNVYLTNLMFTQALSEEFAVFFGKTDTFDGDRNAFAHQRGMNQFSNIGFVANPIALRTVPYSTLAAGFAVMRDGEPIWTAQILNPVESSRTTGFEELFARGVTLATEIRVPTKVMDLPGHHLVGATWSSRTFVSLDQDPRILTGQVPIARSEGSWCVYYNFDQHLWVDSVNPKRGWGLFGRAGIGDADNNPLAYFLSAGVGGTGLFASRPADTFGAGYFLAGVSHEIAPFLVNALGGLGDGQGVELFYNFQITPWCHLTPDFQVLHPGRTAVDTAVVAGLRLNLTL